MVASRGRHKIMLSGCVLTSGLCLFCDILHTHELVTPVVFVLGYLTVYQQDLTVFLRDKHSHSNVSLVSLFFLTLQASCSFTVFTPESNRL